MGSYIAFVSARFKQWKEDEITGVHFFRSLLIYLGFWSHKSAATETTKVPLMNFVFARFLHCVSIIVALFICPISIYTFSTTDVEDLILAVGLLFVAMMIALLSTCVLYRVHLFDDTVTALGAMIDASRHHFVQPDDILDENKDLIYKIILFYGSVLVVFIPPFAVVILGYCIVTRQLPIRLWYPYDFEGSLAFELTLVLWEVYLAAGCHIMVAVSCLCISFLVEALKHLQILNVNLSEIVSLTNEAATNTPRQTQDEEIDVVTLQHSEGESFGTSSDFHQSVRDTGSGTQDDSVVAFESSELAVSAQTIHIIERDRILNTSLRNCAVHHQAIIRFVRTYHKAYDVILLHGLSCCVFPVIVGIIFIQHTPNLYDWRVALFTVLTMTALVVMAIICWLADKITDESEAVREAVYSSDWTGQSESFKRSMRIMMSQGNQTLVLKIMGFIPLTVETFHGVIKLVYSYYMSLETALSLNVDTT